MPEALDLLKTRRSVKPVEMSGPGPAATEIDALLTIASRVPDHGKLTPWRFVVFEGDARLKAGEIIASAFKSKYSDASEDQLTFERARLSRAPSTTTARAASAGVVAAPPTALPLAENAYDFNNIDGIPGFATLPPAYDSGPVMPRIGNP